MFCAALEPSAESQWVNFLAIERITADYHRECRVQPSDVVPSGVRETRCDLLEMAGRSGERRQHGSMRCIRMRRARERRVIVWAKDGSNGG